MATTKPAKKTKSNAVFSDAELEAMQAAKKERKKGSKADGEADLKAAIDKLDGLDRSLAEALHRVVMSNAPNLNPKTWYGMPAWANEEGKAVCFFSPAGKFKVRYASLGFNAEAGLDDGNMWATSFALIKLGPEEEKRIAALVKQAVS